MLIGNPGTERGYLRVVGLDGVESELIRPAPHSWDTGGIFDVNVRVWEIEDRLEELRRQGWDAHSEVVRFTFGPFVVKEVLARGPDGVTIAMIERLEPPLEGWPHLKRLSPSLQLRSDRAGLRCRLPLLQRSVGLSGVSGARRAQQGSGAQRPGACRTT